MPWNPFNRTPNKLTSLLFTAIILSTGGYARIVATEVGTAHDSPATEIKSSEAAAPTTTTYKWNVSAKELPLLGLNEQRLANGFEQSLGYSTTQFEFLILKALTFDEEHGTYLLPTISRNSRSHSFIEFVPGSAANLYVSADGVELQDRGNMKVVKTTDGTKYLFVRYPDDEFRCAMIRDTNGRTLNMLYTANGLLLHGLVDSTGRTVTFNYGVQGIESVTQTWMADSRGFTKTWTVGEEKTVDVSTKYAHAVLTKTGKFLPSNAIFNVYTEGMAASDKLLARIFGGPNAVVGGNGFEPGGLAAAYPLYRGDIRGDDGKVRRGHLSYAMHIYGSSDGTGDSALYVPAGFTAHSAEPSPTDAAVLFYYPRLGNLTDVTLAVFHVADFQLTAEGERVRIGNLGGPGGASALYKHSHIEFYQGNVSSLPSTSARVTLRIDPVTVFGR
jgi:hypothetical protein